MIIDKLFEGCDVETGVDYLENSGAVRSEAGKVMAAKLKGKAASEFMKMNRRYDKICAAKGHFS